MLQGKRNLFFAQLFGLFFKGFILFLFVILPPLLCVNHLFLLSDEVTDGISDGGGSSAKVINVFFLFYGFLAQGINALKGVSVYATGWFLKCRPAPFGSASLQESLNDEVV